MIGSIKADQCPVGSGQTPQQALGTHGCVTPDSILPLIPDTVINENL